MKEDCPFCESFRKKNFDEFEISRIPVKKSRTIYSDYDTGIVAVLEPEQKTVGYALVIPRAHINGIADPKLDQCDFNAVMRVCNLVAKAQMHAFGSDVERVHIASMGEGQQHLHFHVMPRYRLEDKEKDYFLDQPNHMKPPFSEEPIDPDKIKGGFWYWGYQELEWRQKKPRTEEEAGKLGDEIEDTFRTLKSEIEKLTRV